jgi:hypothetical protein
LSLPSKRKKKTNEENKKKIVGVLKVTDENSRIWSRSRIRIH